MTVKKNVAGLKVCKMRLQRRWSHHQLAVELALQGVFLDESLLKRIESLDEFISIFELVAFAIVFGVSIDDLIPKDMPRSEISQMLRLNPGDKPVSNGCDDDGFGPKSATSGFAGGC